MKTIKHLKNNYLQLGNLIYKPYKVCDLPQNFGCINFNEKEGISEWFNYKGYTYLFGSNSKVMSPWDMVAELGIYTEEQIDDMVLCECEEILRQQE